MSGDLLDAVDKAIELMQAKLQTAEGTKGSLADLVRLLQLRKELEGDRPRQVSAKWIEEEDECRISND
jgi:hypothetical protein